MDGGISDVIQQERNEQLSPLVPGKLPLKDHLCLVTERGSRYGNAPIGPVPVPFKMACTYQVAEGGTTNFSGFNSCTNDKLSD